jgi:hypothetical protein
VLPCFGKIEPFLAMWQRRVRANNVLEDREVECGKIVYMDVVPDLFQVVSDILNGGWGLLFTYSFAFSNDYCMASVYRHTGQSGDLLT